MRPWPLILALLLGMAALGGCAGTYYDQSEPAGYDADYGYFYDALSPYGAWYDVAPYGWVWSPYDIPVGWRPYTDGRWVDTEYGWTWLSDDPWGWAPYHYGRWAWDRYYGWIWVPGNVWAPAWVAWRYGDGWIGWAPLPPQVGWSGSDLDYGSYDAGRDISRYRWSFCKEEDFTATRVRTVVVPRSRNVTLLGTTKDVTRYGSADGHPAIRGFTSAMLQRDLNRPVARYQVTDAPGVGRDRAAVVRGDAVEMYRPVIRDRTPKGDRTPPNARNRAGEQQRLEERNRAREEARRQRTETDPGQTDAGQSATSQRERSEIQPPGRKGNPNVQAPAPGMKPTDQPESKPAPVAEPQPPGAISQAEADRRAAEQRELDERIRSQRQELKQEQQKDLKQPPPGISRAELQKRHEEEQKSQAEVEKRDREELRNREELRRQWEEQQRRAQQEREATRQRAEQQKARQREEQRQQRDEEKEQRKEQKQQPNPSQNQDQGQDRGQSRDR